MKHFLKFGCVVGMCLSGTAYAQVNVVRQPLPEYQSIADVPVEYNDEGIMQAQHIRPGDVSPEEYQALLDEADRVRAYQSRDGYTSSSAGTVDYGYNYENINISSASAPVTDGGNIYQSELPLYETPQSDTRYRAQTSTYASAPIAEATSHYVVKGDTLYSISKRYGVNVNTLKSANSLANNIIQPGQFLTVPSAGASYGTNSSYNASTVIAPYSPQTAPTYVRSTDPLIVSVPSSGIYAVLPGDTLYSISRRACVRVDALQNTNSFVDPNELQPGQRLRMPAGHCL